MSEKHNHFVIEDLHCYGCVHSDVQEIFPSGPSGERPCTFCIRNPWRNLRPDDWEATWFDGSEPVSDPMDCYQTIEMREQWTRWLHEAEHAGSEALNRLIDLKTRLGEKRGSG